MPSKSFVKVIGLLLLLSLGPLSIYILYTNTGGLESRRELAFHRNIRFAFMAGTETVDLALLTDWPWVRVCAFGAGLSHKEVDDLVGFSYDNFSQLTWRHLDDHWTLLFIDSERHTNWGRHRPIVPIRIPVEAIADYSFGQQTIGTCVNRDQAALSLERQRVVIDRSPVTARLVRKDIGGP